MITDSLIKQEFIHNVLQRDARLIADTQVDRLRRHRTQRARQIALQLAGQPFRISGTGLHATLTFNILTSLRFMDISISRDIRAGASKALALYNRVVWGILYHDNLGDLKFGLTEDLRREIREQLLAASPAAQS